MLSSIKDNPMVEGSNPSEGIKEIKMPANPNDGPIEKSAEARKTQILVNQLAKENQTSGEEVWREFFRYCKARAEDAKRGVNWE